MRGCDGHLLGVTGQRGHQGRHGMALSSLTRRKLRSAASIPAAVQRRTTWPSFQRLTLRQVVRAIEIIDSTGLVEVNVRVSRSLTPSRRDGEHLLQAPPAG
jgi:hypothetical protein